MKGKIFFLFVVLFVVCFSGQPAFAKKVSADYFISEFEAIRDYHRSILDIISPRPTDKSLKVYAFKVLQADFRDFKQIEPPEGYREVKRKILHAMKMHMAALQFGIQGRPNAMQYWKKGDVEFEAIDKLLRKGGQKKKKPPLLDPNFKPVETLLTPQQAANRYFLVRMTNRELGQKIIQRPGDPARIDFTIEALRTQIRLLQESKYPAQMNPIKDKMLRSLNMSLQWVDFVKAGKPFLAAVKQNEMRVLLKQIDEELKWKYGIVVPHIFEVP